VVPDRWVRQSRLYVLAGRLKLAVAHGLSVRNSGELEERTGQDDVVILTKANCKSGASRKPVRSKIVIYWTRCIQSR